MAQQSIVDLFYAANKLHAQYEQKYGRKMVAPEQENSSRVLEFVDTQNRKVSVLLELRGDRHALVLLAEMVQKLDRVPPRQILFIVEGLGRQGIEQPRYSPQYLAEEIAQRYKIALTGGIKTVADWDVITEVIAECAVQRPPVPRKRVIGALLLSESLKSWRRSKQNILEAIETLASCWNTPEQRVVSISELYAASERFTQLEAEQKKQINALMAAAAKKNAGRLDLENWLVVTEIIDDAVRKGLARDLVLGSAVNTMAPVDAGGYPDFVHAMNTAMQTWGEGVGREELHKCLISAQADRRKSPDSFMATTQKIGQIFTVVQTELTAINIQRALQENNRARNVLVVASLIHEKVIRSAFGY